MIFCACGCGKSRPDKDSRGRTRQFIKGHCDAGHFKKGIRKVGADSPTWKGGIRKVGGGYITIWKPDHPHATLKGYVLEHRLIMEQYLDRYLLPTEHVHHINLNTSDNRIENLQVMSIGEHIKHHDLQRPIIERLYWGKNHALRSA